MRDSQSKTKDGVLTLHQTGGMHWVFYTQLENYFESDGFPPIRSISDFINKIKKSSLFENKNQGTASFCYAFFIYNSYLTEKKFRKVLYCVYILKKIWH